MIECLGWSGGRRGRWIVLWRVCWFGGLGLRGSRRGGGFLGQEVAF